MPEQNKKTLTEQMVDITTKSMKAQKEKEIMRKRQQTLLSQQIAAKRSSRGPSSAGRISGLQTLKPKMGKQFSKNDISDLLS